MQWTYEYLGPGGEEAFKWLGLWFIVNVISLSINR